MDFQPYINKLSDAMKRGADWIRQAEGWQLLVALVVLAILLPLTPALLFFAGLAALYVFAKAWIREFVFLMKLKDTDFPGAHDKLIWAMLLIVLAPVGVWLFHSYREAHWPEAKPADYETARDWS